MATLILKVIPILCIAAAIFYSSLWGARLYRAKGVVSGAAVAALFVGLTAGRLFERTLWPASLPTDVSDLSMLSVETAIQFATAALICVVGACVVRRDALGQPPPEAGARGLAPALVLFILGFIVAAHEKMAIAATHVLEGLHLL
ncbi:MAG TPA: hypothetical protein VGG34_09295 [Opitutaceae bacterium]|jgi:hypothetical protein